MPAEVITYRLLQRNQPVGTHVLRSEQQGSISHLEGRLELTGSLGRVSITQTSRAHARRHFSMSFREEQQKRGENRNFDVQFDRGSGLVTARIGTRDAASVPYFMQYRDPLSLLQEVRQLPEEVDTVTVPLLGHDVTVQLIGETALETVMGPRQARVYRLLPGGSLVWVDSARPNLILQMQQKLEGAPVDAILLSLEHEETGRQNRPTGEDRSGGRARQRGQRRRRRRRT